LYLALYLRIQQSLPLPAVWRWPEVGVHDRTKSLASGGDHDEDDAARAGFFLEAKIYV
jgi:hypothetical protein